MSAIKTAIAAIVDVEHHQVLMLRRRDDDRGYPSHWCFPGGRIADDETSEDAAIRETLEETGLRISHLRHVGTRASTSAHPRRYDVDGYVTTEWRGQLMRYPTPEHQDARWVSITDVPTLTPLGPATRWLATLL